MIRDHFMPAIRATLVTLLLTGVAYPLLCTGLAQVLFPSRANGSLLSDDAGRAIGSVLIGQGFASAGYFQPRPSAAGDKGWDANNSSGSNLGPTSKKLRDRVTAEVGRLKAENPDASGEVPAELVATSASGLDPHLSPEAVRWQLLRVARSRGVSPERIAPLIGDQLEGRDFGFLGEPRVNVLLLNLALDRLLGHPQ
jgi:K+-transporting ATPase ATPase C chain